MGIITSNSDIEKLFGNRENYFHLEALDADTITLSCTYYDKYIEFAVNDGDWDRLEYDNQEVTKTVQVSAGDKIYFRGHANQGQSNFANVVSGITCSFNLGGIFMSLVREDFISQNKIPDNLENYAFASYFSGNGFKIVDASNLTMPTNAKSYCFSGMFQNCTYLTKAPKLPAKELASNCYNNMFFGCTSLTAAPELPAKELASNCYSSMFNGCTSLTTAPELPATTLCDSCYNAMLNNTNVLPDCSNIDFANSIVVSSGGLQGLFTGTKVTDNDLAAILPINDNNKYCLPVGELSSNCYSSMFNGCTSLTTAPELPATTLQMNCYNSMFSGCTNLTTAPELSAATLVSSCYKNLFNGCSKLDYIKALFTTKPTTSNCGNWVSGVASSGTFVKSSEATWSVSGVYGVPTGWTIETV